MAGESKTLGELVTLQRGNTYKSALLDQPGPVLLGLASIQRDGGFRSDKLRTYGGECDERMILLPGDIYVSLKDVTQSGDLLGAVARVPPYVESGRVTQDTVKLNFCSENPPKKLVYWSLRAPQYRAFCRAHATGTTNLGLPREDFLSFPIPPNTPAIGTLIDLLESLDDKIELNRRMNETLETMAQAIFKSWFVDFDPVRAKMDGQQPAGMNPETAALFPDSFEEQDGEMIPKGWEKKRMGDVSDLKWGDTNVTKKSYTQTGFTAFSAKGSDGLLPYHDFDRIGVVVSAIGANAGVTWLARGKWSCIKNTIRFWATDESLSTEYLFFATHGDNIWPLRGSAQPFISQTDARNIRILCPSNSLARTFGEMVDPTFAAIDHNRDESKTLANLRDTLLPKLLSGELRVPEAEKQVEEVV
jgi:type I restriction enzyme, S subunit